MSHVCLWHKADITRLSFNVRPKKADRSPDTAGRQGIKPVCAGIGESSAAAQACALKHIAKAKDPRVPLVITADLAATSKATITSRHGSTGSSVDNFEIRPSLTDVAAGVTPGPKIWWWRGALLARSAAEVT